MGTMTTIKENEVSLVALAHWKIPLHSRLLDDDSDEKGSDDSDSDSDTTSSDSSGSSESISGSRSDDESSSNYSGGSSDQSSSKSEEDRNPQEEGTTDMGNVPHSQGRGTVVQAGPISSANSAGRESISGRKSSQTIARKSEQGRTSSNNSNRMSGRESIEGDKGRESTSTSKGGFISALGLSTQGTGVFETIIEGDEEESEDNDAISAKNEPDSPRSDKTHTRKSILTKTDKIDNGQSLSLSPSTNVRQKSRRTTTFKEHDEVIPVKRVTAKQRLTKNDVKGSKASTGQTRGDKRVEKSSSIKSNKHRHSKAGDKDSSKETSSTSKKRSLKKMRRQASFYKKEKKRKKQEQKVKTKSMFQITECVISRLNNYSQVVLHK